MATLGYIDPASGALIVQLVGAAIVGMVAFFRKTIWGGFLSLLGRAPVDGEAVVEPGADADEA